MTSYHADHGSVRLVIYGYNYSLPIANINNAVYKHGGVRENQVFHTSSEEEADPWCLASPKRGERSISGGISSFSAFNRTMGNAQEGYHWHHIVGRHEYNVTKFGAENIHNTNNLVEIPKDVHRKITDHYNSKPRDLGGLRIYEWLRTQNFESQDKYGREILNKALNGKL